ncbi:MAG TPA: class I SAM-dependent methyltransferase, partial [Polyangiales bacterium]
PRCCVDLGAGPGFLARSLHRALEAERTVGLEFSQRFVAYGQRDLPAGIELLQHDVTTSLPVAGDVVVARFLLTHLSNPLASLRIWRASEPLLLVLEELVQVSADLPVLQRYYELVATVQRSAGQDMHIGSRLADLAASAGFAVESHRVQRLELSLQAMARLHALSLPTLRQLRVVTQQFAERELDAMQRALEELASDRTGGCVHVDMARCRAVTA